MLTAKFRFYAELNDFLPRVNRMKDINVDFRGHESVKHLIESLGVPHTEVDVILVNGSSVDFSTHLDDRDLVEIYPVSNLLINLPLVHLQPDPLNESRFVLDGHLGKLASYLRLMGFDVLYRNDFDDDELAEVSRAEERILLTRDRGLLKRSQVSYGYCVRGKTPRNQIIEVLKRFDLSEKAKPFGRCARCNGMIIPVKKADVLDRLEPKTRLYYGDFRICRKCDQIYWKGSHFKRLEQILKSFVELSG